MIFKDIKIRQKKPYSEQQADAKENFPQHRLGWKQSFMFGEKRFCGMGFVHFMVEAKGFEPSTPALRTLCSPN